MSATTRLLRRVLSVLTIALIFAVMSAPVWAGRRHIDSKPRNYPQSPVDVSRSRVTLVETYPSLSQVATPGSRAKFSRVRYANRGNQVNTVLMLEGTLVCRNKSRKAIQALGLLVIPLDAFHAPLGIVKREGSADLKQVRVSLGAGSQQVIEWEQEVVSAEIFEVAVVILRVRFTDGSVWKAPARELVDIF